MVLNYYSVNFYTIMACAVVICLMAAILMILKLFAYLELYNTLKICAPAAYFSGNKGVCVKKIQDAAGFEPFGTKLSAAHSLEIVADMAKFKIVDATQQALGDAMRYVFPKIYKQYWNIRFG